MVKYVLVKIIHTQPDALTGAAYNGCQRVESCGGKNQWRYYNECNFYETAS